LPPTRMTFAELAETWVEGFAAQVVAGERGERTLENYRYHLERNLLPVFGHPQLAEISTMTALASSPRFAPWPGGEDDRRRARSARAHLRARASPRLHR
jgi:hypothetical protein